MLLTNQSFSSCKLLWMIVSVKCKQYSNLTYTFVIPVVSAYLQCFLNLQSSMNGSSLANDILVQWISNIVVLKYVNLLASSNAIIHTRFVECLVCRAETDTGGQVTTRTWWGPCSCAWLSTRASCSGSGTIGTIRSSDSNIWTGHECFLQT